MSLNILLTGANGYIGKRLLPVLLDAGHTVYCSVRDKDRFWLDLENTDNLHVLEIDFLDPPAAAELPQDIDVAYYLIHSMSASIGDFEEMEAKTAENFRSLANDLGIKQLVFLSGIANAEELSEHLASRKNVEEILKEGTYATTILRAGIIVGSGSASFEIIRDLVEKLPVMIAPKWVLTLSQPLAVRDIITCLSGVLMREECLNETFDVAGANALTYREMMLQFAEVRGLRRYIITVPVMTPRLSSYWLYFVTSTSYKLAVNLVNSMKVEVLAKDNRLPDILGYQPSTYRQAIERAFEKIEQNLVLSSWKDAVSSSRQHDDLNQYIEVPTYGCFKEERKIEIPGQRVDEVLDNIWSIGGDRGWYYATWLWRIRGFMDKLSGGVGLRRGRTHPNEIHSGDALDFWRVIFANKEKKRLLLLAEMLLPGEAWLEFNIQQKDNRYFLYQIATFRPRGVWGRLYWYAVKPFHYFIFDGMLRNIARAK